MTEIEPYKIAGVDTLNIEKGSTELPYFYKISSGQRDTKSLVFHAKISTEYHQYLIRQVNKKSVNLACTNRNCNAKANAKISPDLIIEGPPKKRGNKLRSSYKVDYSNQRMRDLSNYVFIEHNSHFWPSNSKKKQARFCPHSNLF